MKTKFLLIQVLAILMIVSCKKETPPQNAVNPNQEQPKAIAENQLEIVGDEVLVPGFKANLQLNDELFQKLKNAKESVIADYYFYGNVADENKLSADVKEYLDLFGLKLAGNTIEITEISEPEITFAFKGIRIPKKLYDALSDKDVHLNINFYSGRKSFENNILDVDAFDSSFNDVLKNNNTLIYKAKLLKLP